jgi:hypothetical protein
MRRRSICIFFVLLLVVALIIGIAYVYLSQTPLVEYNKSLVISEDTYPTAKNISIYYDVCFHNVTFSVVDDPGFMIKIDWQLTVLVEGAVGKNTALQVTNTTNGEFVHIEILKENPADVCALHAGEARATVNVTINNAYTIDIEAAAGNGNMNMTTINATFQNIYFHHGINCYGNNGIYLTNSTVYDDLTCHVSTGYYFVKLDNVMVGGTVTCTPTDRGTLIEI